MAIAKHTREYNPASTFDDRDLQTLYSLNSAGKVLYRRHPVRGADPKTFRFYLGSFAKDAKHCYCQNKKLQGANPETFRALNYTYYTDGQSVWALGGKLEDCDAATFQVCDDGIEAQSLVPDQPLMYGYGKDKDRVYYYDFSGKPKWVRKAAAASFVSLNDGIFGKDAKYVFCGTSPIPKADVATWQPLGSNYSADIQRVFYFNREIDVADRPSFCVVPHRIVKLAKDRHRYYCNDEVVTKDAFDDLRK